jgi:hypothetical protein
MKNNCYLLNLMEKSSVNSSFHYQVLFLKYVNINSIKWTKVLTYLPRKEWSARISKCTTQTHTNLIMQQNIWNYKFFETKNIIFSITNWRKILFFPFLFQFPPLSVFSYTCYTFLSTSVTWCVREILTTFQKDCFKFQTVNVWLLLLLCS